MKRVAAILSVGFFLAMTGSAVGATIVTDGLVSRWTFDADTVQGDTIEDVWGQNDGTMQGDAKISNDGKIGQAIELDGAGDFISIDAPIDIPIGNDTYAIEAWFFANTGFAAPYLGIMGWGAYGSLDAVNALMLMKNKGFRHYWWGNDLDWETNDELTGEWHHVIAQFDGSIRSIWFDGEMVASDEPVGHDATMDDVTIGVTQGRTFFFDGRIDGVDLYNRALTEEEVQQNFESEGRFMAVVNLARKLPGLWGEIKAAE